MSRLKWNKEKMDSVMKYATLRDSLMLLWWIIFKRKRMQRFLNNVNDGMHFKAAVLYSKYK